MFKAKRIIMMLIIVVLSAHCLPSAVMAEERSTLLFSSVNQLLDANKLQVTKTPETITISGRLGNTKNDFVTVIVLGKDDDITLLDKDNIKGKTVQIGQTKSDNDGSFSYTYKAKKAQDVVGVEEYRIYVGVSSVDAQFWGEYQYISLDVQIDFVNQVNSPQVDYDRIKQLIENPDNKMIVLAMGMLLGEYQSENLTDANRESIIKSIVNGKKSAAYTMQTLSKTFNCALTVEKINEAVTQAAVNDILDTYCEIADIRTNDNMLYRNLSALQKEFIGGVLFAATITDIDALRQAVITGDFLYRINQASYDQIENVLNAFEDSVQLNAIPEYGDYKKITSANVKNAIYKEIVKDAVMPFTTKDSFVDSLKRAVHSVTVKPDGSGGGSFPSRGGGSSSSGAATAILTTTPKATPVVFKDLDNVPWAVEAIGALTQKGVIAGVNKNEFAPDQEIKREEFVKIIVLAFNLLDENATCQFNDVKKPDWFYPYVASAQKYNIVSGYDQNLFGVSDKISREQMATILYRVAERNGIALKAEKNIIFDDQNKISDFAKESVWRLSAAGLISGVGNNWFAPQTAAKRAEAAKIIYAILQR